MARLLCGLLVKAENKIRLIGDESLSKRDFSRLKFLKLFGVDIKTKNGFLPLEIQGSKFLRPAKITEKLGSAQVKSCAIFGGLNTPGITFIKAKKSRNHTESLLKYLKYPLIVKSKGAYDYIKLKGLNHLKGFNYDVPGDISSAACFIVLTLLSKNSKILIKKVNVNKTRVGVIKILNKMNAKIQIKNNRLYKGEETADIYVKSKNKGEELILSIHKRAVILRPSVVFGPSDNFINMFGNLASSSMGLYSDMFLVTLGYPKWSIIIVVSG